MTRTICLLVLSAASVLAQGQISKSTTALGYPAGGTTPVDLRGTALMPQVSGEAKVQASRGATKIEAKLTGLAQPTTLGAEFLTYVLWSVSPDGRCSNVGEVIWNAAGNGELTASTELTTFSLIVTAEPYFAVSQPSEMVVAENQAREGTKAKVFPVQEYKLLKREQYGKLGNPLALSVDLKRVPLEMYEARNAVDIARSRKAPEYAPDIFSKAESSLKAAEGELARKANKKLIIAAAREAVQFSEDARALASRRQDEERIAADRAAAAAKAKAEAEAKAAMEAKAAREKADAEAAEAKRRADAEAAELKRRAEEEKQRAEEQQRRTEEEARRQAELAAAREAEIKAKAEAAAAKAEADARILKAKEEAAKAEADRARRAAEELRAQLLGQFNRVLETRDTPRGLVVNLADVLFDTGKFNLRPITREKLARFAGIVLAHSGLNLEIEGHTDSTGSDELNQTLSEKRAESVRAYLLEQGLAEAQMTSKGFGKTAPVADNATAAGRQQNRRVEIVVSGEVIGAKIGSKSEQ